MKLAAQQPIQPSFNAKVIVAAKENIIREAGKRCAEQLEIALPAIKKIAEKEKNIDEILIRPVIRDYKFNNPDEEEITRALNIAVVKYKHNPLYKTFSDDENLDNFNNDLINGLEYILNVYKRIHKIEDTVAIEKTSKPSWFTRLLDKLTK